MIRKPAPVKPDENKNSVDLLIEQRRRQAEQKNFRRQKRRLFKASLLCALIVMGLAYYSSDASLIKTVSVKGNVSLSRADVLELAGITAQTRWLTVFAPQVKNALQQYPLIVSASVRHERGNQIVIEIEEREPVGYRYIEEPEILFKDGTVVKMDERMTGLIARIPLIVGFQSEEQSADLAMAFRHVPAAMISLISEIQQYEVSYDPNMIRLIMHDGNQFAARPTSSSGSFSASCALIVVWTCSSTRFSSDVSSRSGSGGSSTASFTSMTLSLTNVS